MGTDADATAQAAAEQARHDVAQLTRLAAAVQAAHRQYDAQAQRWRSSRADRARRGELGPEMRELQGRVDRRETTWQAIAQGADTHPSAVRARAHLAEHLDDLRRQLGADEEFRDLRARTAAAARRAGLAGREGEEGVATGADQPI